MQKTKPRGLVIQAMASSDAHVVANRLIERMLREEDYEVINLGACVSVGEIMAAYDRRPDAIAIAVGSLNGHAVQDLATLASAKAQHNVRCPVILGGNLGVGSIDRIDVLLALKEAGVDVILTSPKELLGYLASLSSEVPRAASY